MNVFFMGDPVVAEAIFELPLVATTDKDFCFGLVGLLRGLAHLKT